MFVTLAALAAFTLSPQSDTTVTVTRGARLEVNDYGGAITVRAWDRNEVRVSAPDAQPGQVVVDASGSVVSVRTESTHGDMESVDLEVSVPAWMPLTLEGVYADITVSGVKAAIAAQTVQGDVNVTGGAGRIRLQSVDGGIRLSGASGDVKANTVSEDVVIEHCTCDVDAQSVDGDVRISDATSSSVTANTVDGDIAYDGTIADGGHYAFSTHDGDLDIAIPAGANATVSASTFDGDFNATFPVNLTGTSDRRFNFTLGSGSARIELESFDGDITLRHRTDGGAGRSRRDRGSDNEENQQ